MRALKLRAVNEGRRLKDVLEVVVRVGLEQPTTHAEAMEHHVRLPLVDCRHEAAPDEEVTPDRTAQILLDEEMPTAGGAA